MRGKPLCLTLCLISIFGHIFAVKNTNEAYRYLHVTLHVVEVLTFFGFVGERDKNITVKCKLCLGDKCLSDVKNSTSNLKKHL